jgi:hypothetical protein
MNKKTLLIVLAVLIVGFGAYALWGRQYQPAVPITTPAHFDPLNATYVVEGQPVALINGKAATRAAPGSVTQVTTMTFGEPVIGDLNGDGAPDAAVMLVQNPGGSGTFYYVAAAINTDNGAQGTNAILLGDRVAPQNIEIRNGQILANYADRAPGEPMTAPPSVGVTKYLIYNGSILVAVPFVAGPGEHCGGNIMTAAVCGIGYHCAPAPGSPLPFGDVGGTCVHD